MSDVVARSLAAAGALVARARAAAGGLLARSRATAGQTKRATLATLRRRDAAAVFASVTVAYLLAYLYAIGHLAPGGGGFDLFVVEDPLGRLFRQSLGAFSFEPVAVVELGPVVYLASLNTVLGLGLAVLVGLNLALTYLAWRQPKACGLATPSTAAVAGVPALLSGAACCGPILLIVVGVQATGLLLTAFEWLVPVATMLLVGSLFLVGRQVDPELL